MSFRLYAATLREYVGRVARPFRLRRASAARSGELLFRLSSPARLHPAENMRAVYKGRYLRRLTEGLPLKASSSKYAFCCGFSLQPYNPSAAPPLCKGCFGSAQDERRRSACGQRPSPNAGAKKEFRTEHPQTKPHGEGEPSPCGLLSVIHIVFGHFGETRLPVAALRRQPPRYAFLTSSFTSSAFASPDSTILPDSST